MSPTKNFLGIPVDGDITRGHSQVAQRPLSDLEPLLRAVINDDAIAAFGWTQYTPYFNDGEPCTFSVGEPWFLTPADAVTAEEDEDFESDSYTVTYGEHPTLGGREYEYVNRERTYKGYVGPNEAAYDRCVALATAINSNAFENVLLEAFGDHAEVKVTRDGITVEYYEHD